MAAQLENGLASKMRVRIESGVENVRWRGGA